MCHESSYIDFSQFSSALIIGKVENNELYSNGVGKTTIFKAIEYVLFNQADVNLEKIIRDDEASCKITLDFSVENQEYRVIRTRTRKGSTDVSLLERNTNVGDENEVYHVNNKTHDGLFVPVISDKFWKDISGRRAVDTEKDLAKLLKINFKSFRSTVHFMQNDFSGLTSATPEKRKGILKEALNLAIYSKLEKLAKEKSNLLSKDIDRHKTLIDNLNDPSKDLEGLNDQVKNADQELTIKNQELDNLNVTINSQKEKINNLTRECSNLEGKFADLIAKSNILNLEKSNIETSIKEYSNKKNNIIKSANEIIAELKTLKDSREKLSSIDFSQIEILTKEISLKKEILAENNVHIQNNILKVEELKIPLPANASCKHCRQSLSKEHRDNCQTQINEELKVCQENILSMKKKVSSINEEINLIQQTVNSLNNSNKELNKTSDLIILKEKEISDKKIIHKEYVDLFNKFQKDLEDKEKEIALINLELNSSAHEEAEKIKKTIEAEKLNLENLNAKWTLLNKEITHFNNLKAVLLHNIEQKNADRNKKEELQKSLLALNEQYSVYPSVLQAFSSTGIPNLIIQNVLDDLQIEANSLLAQLKPSLQLSFSIEKTKSDGTESDTLDINYYLNGKERQYDQLSGAQKLAVTFSLKLGLSFLLQKMVGTNIKFLLLDEIDQSLDKASVDAFADIVKHFQKDFTILIITHNDRLKDKFSHAICVEQDINMASRAKVVTHW
jgi:DNA repair exonuclease SbcCD ATPase subunit